MVDRGVCWNELACRIAEMEEEKLWYVGLRMNDVDDDRTSCCSVLQQEVITLKAQVADQTGLAEAKRAIKRQSKLKKTLRVCSM